MIRIKKITPGEMSQEQLKIHRAITSGDRAKDSADFSLVNADGSLEGPFNAMLLNPIIGNALQELGNSIRYHGELSDRSREIAILTVAVFWQSPFELRVHERIGAKIGLSNEEIQAIKDNKDLILENEEESLVLWATRHLLIHDRLSSDDYKKLETVLTAEKIFELSTLIGYYTLLAKQMLIFDVK